MDTGVRLVVAIGLGLIFGSFLTVAIHRLPRKESVVRPRSRCPACGTPVRAIDNVPVVSWLLLRGRCRSCGARISAIYPLIELACGGLFAAAVLRFDNLWLAWLFAPFLGLLAAITVIDWRHKIIPNRLVYPAVLAAGGYLLLAWVADGPVDLADAFIGLAAYGGGLLLVALLAPRGMGMGDVKLAGLVGLVLGALGIRFVAVAAGVGVLLGGVGAIVALLFGATRKTGLPYGPFIAIGAAIATFAGDELADAYLRFVT